uniref:phospholipase effector Tle1 domain-containing protein n=1 Tax=Verminephrobacter aporrectodeae TaxID=1110389 RepID=UPI0038B2F8C3
MRISLPSGESVQLQYGAQGRLQQVTDPQGRKLRLNYREARLERYEESSRAIAKPPRYDGVQSMDSPAGRFEYSYGSALPQGSEQAKVQEPREQQELQVSANLVQVRHPAEQGKGITRHYHYEDARFPTLLTGISVSGQGSDGRPMNERIASYGYDANALAISSVRGAPDSDTEKVTLDTRTPRQTVLTNSQGQKTTYRHGIIAMQWRLLEVRGAGCASCGPSNERYQYDAMGRITEVTQLDPQGQPVSGKRTELDTYGRPVKISTVAYAKGRAQPAQWQLRYGYASAQYAPELIARPSVVPGREQQTRIRYNAAGQPTEVTESGFSPLNPQGQPIANAEQATPINRTTHYRYAMVGGKSVLVEIDGPLANGPQKTPQDSDVTRLEWDRGGGFITRIEQPGGRRSQIEHDPRTGLITQVSNEQNGQTRFRYNSATQLISTRSTGPGRSRPQEQSYRYDALGQLSETGQGSLDADKDRAEEAYRPQTRLSVDAQGRLQWQANAHGVIVHNRYDSESRLLETGRYSAGMAQQQHYRYDAQGQLLATWDNTGAVLHIGYDARGQIQDLTDGAGRNRLLPPQPGTAGAQPMRDDFGRIVRTSSPDAGSSIREYDAADRLIANRDAAGNQAHYAYDPAGRILRQDISDTADPKKTTTTTTWHYTGSQLTALEHPTQSEHYQHDPQGLRTERRTIRHQADGSTQNSLTRYTYDEQGNVLSTNLPDGSRLIYQRDPQGQIVALQRSRIQTRWLQWLSPPQTIVQDLKRDLVGLSQLRTGNGIEAHYQRSQEGVLARVVYRRTQPMQTARRAAAAELLGQTSQLLLGVRSAHAQSAPTKPTDHETDTEALPGALGLAADPQALMDQRYLWDTRGNLLHREDRAGESARSSYAYDARNRLVAGVQAQGQKNQVNRYHYDPDERRVLSQQGVETQDELQKATQQTRYPAQSHRWSEEQAQGATAVLARYDANGQPTQIGQREYQWDALGKLTEVREKGTSLARYHYNHRGERISKTTASSNTAYLYEDRQLSAELDAQGRITRQYIYLANRPIATIDTPAGRPLADAPRRVLADLKIIVQSWFDQAEKIVWLHANHLGAIEAATDAQGQLAWQASYAPFGQASIRTVRLDAQAAQTDFTLNLRLPGQYADSETGLYYNGQRYYDPERGQYLTPDPLGTPDGPNPYSYVRYNPLKYIDPDGLVLFAFDGTGNSTNASDLNSGSNMTNVISFQRYYDESNGAKRYISGVGTVDVSDPSRPIKPRRCFSPALPDPSDTPPKLSGNLPDPYRPFLEYISSLISPADQDKGLNCTGPDRIERMIEYFNAEASKKKEDEIMQVDIIGFSRGAAQARDFANRVAAKTDSKGWYSYKDQETKEQVCRKVNFRFMGLWDTVLSTNHSLYKYKLAIPAQFSYVAHAVALNEHRSNILPGDRPKSTGESALGAFPLESIMGTEIPKDKTRMERGFIGSHADVGGGYKDDSLSNVALAWMVEQARSAGVEMTKEPIKVSPNPVLHDKSENINNGEATGNLEDRDVRYADGKIVKQIEMSNTGLTHDKIKKHGFINYTPRDLMPRIPYHVPVGPNPALVTEEKYIYTSNETGTVNMKKYQDWLLKNGYDLGNLRIK